MSPSVRDPIKCGGRARPTHSAGAPHKHPLPHPRVGTSIQVKLQPLYLRFSIIRRPYTESLHPGETGPCRLQTISLATLHDLELMLATAAVIYLHDSRRQMSSPNQPLAAHHRRRTTRTASIGPPHAALSDPNTVAHVSPPTVLVVGTFSNVLAKAVRLSTKPCRDTITPRPRRCRIRTRSRFPRPFTCACQLRNQPHGQPYWRTCLTLTQHSNCGAVSRSRCLGSVPSAFIPRHPHVCPAAVAPSPQQRSSGGVGPSPRYVKSVPTQPRSADCYD